MNPESHMRMVSRNDRNDNNTHNKRHISRFGVRDIAPYCHRVKLDIGRFPRMVPQPCSAGRSSAKTAQKAAC